MNAFDPNDPRQIRVFTFPDRTDVILIYVPDGQELWLPRLPTPFHRYEVAKRLGDADIPAVVRESVPGRFTHALKVAVSDDRATRGQMQREAEAARHVQIRFSDDASTYQQKRSALVLAKNEVDEEIRSLKVKIGQAKSRAATHGQFMIPSEYRAMEARLAELQTTSLAIQRRLGEIRRQENERRDGDQPAQLERFVQIAKKYLTAEQFKSIWAEVGEGIDRSPGDARP